MLRYDGRCALWASLLRAVADLRKEKQEGCVVSFLGAQDLRLEDYRLTLTLGRAWVNCSK
jgi:hypothetical protein